VIAGQDFFFVFIALWPFCAAKWNGPAICTTRELWSFNEIWPAVRHRQTDRQTAEGKHSGDIIRDRYSYLYILHMHSKNKYSMENTNMVFHNYNYWCEIHFHHIESYQHILEDVLRGIWIASSATYVGYKERNTYTI
jgi:hypothetical protein